MNFDIQAKDIRALFIDFNDTISPANFIPVLEQYEDQTKWEARTLVQTYIDAGLLDQIMAGHLTVPEFWQGVSDLTGIAFELLKEVYQVMLETKVVDADMITLLEQIKHERNIPLVLITDNVLEMLNYWTGKYRLRETFDFIVNSAEHSVTKKEPAIYQLALGMVGMEPEQALLIDDDPRYLEVACGVGLHVLQFTDINKLREDLATIGF